MTWRDKTAIAVLMLVARMLISEQWRDEVNKLATHISVHCPEAK
jgi:hypothetical protein